MYSLGMMRRRRWVCAPLSRHRREFACRRAAPPVQEVVLLRHDLLEGAAAGEVQVGAPAGGGGCRCRRGDGESMHLRSCNHANHASIAGHAETVAFNVVLWGMCAGSSGELPDTEPLPRTCSCGWSTGRWPP